jgi:DNA-binding beta-propeller fold protein YncE
LPGRPRWCVYERSRDRFLVNIREPASVVVLAAATLETQTTFVVSSSGPHGLDLDPASDRAFVACDGGVVVALDLASGRDVGRVSIPGAPDAIWFNAEKNHLYVAIVKPGLLCVIDTVAMREHEEVTTEEGAGTTAYDADRQRVYVFLPSSCRAAVYEET